MRSQFTLGRLIATALILFAAFAAPWPAAAQGTQIRVALGATEVTGDTTSTDLGAEAVAAAGAMLVAGGKHALCTVVFEGEGAGAGEITLSGRVEIADGQASWTYTLTRAPNAEVVGTLTGTAPADALSGAADALADAMLASLCPTSDAGGPTTYIASGGGANIVISGQVERIDAVFRLSGSFTGGTAEFEYTPVSPGGGAVEYTLAGSGVAGAGEGLYTISPGPDGAYIVEQTTNGCIDGIPNSCRQHSETITLTPER